jgi:hypothetical protein
VDSEPWFPLISVDHASEFYDRLGPKSADAMILRQGPWLGEKQTRSAEYPTLRMWF